MGRLYCRFVAYCCAAAVLTLLVGGPPVGFIRPAEALPSFARQTGQPCGTCHTDYPGLTPYGRLFKMGGYTAGGGRFRTALFPTGGNAANAALSSYARKIDGKAAGKPGLGAYAKKIDGENGTGSILRSDTGNTWVPPLSLMAVFGFTHTQEPKDNSPLNPNDNWTIPEISLFWGGAITSHLGAFSQWTYDGRRAWGWDNQDIRYSNTAMLGMMNVIYGITVDNNPTVGDPWNTVPAWGFPYMSSEGIAPETPATLIDGGMEMAVVGVGAYGFFNNLVYLKMSGYHAIDPNTLHSLGAPVSDAGSIDGVAPYWRVAIEPHWGRNWFEVGTFGMYARLYPWVDPDAFIKFGQTDSYTDVAFDTQYQYQGDNYWITLRGTYIHESQSLGGSANPMLGNASNLSNTLNTLKLYASWAYGNDNRVVLTGQYFNVWGSADTGLYPDGPNGSPNANGFIAEIAYIPFISSHSPIWPWANVRLGLKYTYFNEFNGMTMGAQANNTLFLYAWLAM